MLRLILVDDEPLARQGLKEMLAAMPQVSIVGEADGVAAAATLVPELRPDAILLDIRMPRADGFQLLSQLKDCPPVIFITAYAEYAARAFDVQAVDYLLKPVLPERLARALARIPRASGPSDAEKTPYDSGDRICLRTPERTLIAPLADVILLQAEKDFTRVTVAGERPILICQSLGVYERNLPGPPFLRLDRSTMLNLARLQAVEISPSRGAHATLSGLEAPLPLGPSALRRLRKAIPDFLGEGTGA